MVASTNNMVASANNMVARANSIRAHRSHVACTNNTVAQKHMIVLLSDGDMQHSRGSVYHIGAVAITMGARQRGRSLSNSYLAVRVGCA